jgi:hypothetical protein
MVVDAKRAKVKQRTGRSATFSLSAENPDQAEQDTVTYQIPHTIELEPGRYQLRASAMSKKLDKGGSVYLDIIVPDFSSQPLALTTIALGFADGPRVPVGRTRAIPFGGITGPGIATPIVPPAQVRAQNGENPLPFEPTLSREFQRADAIRAYFKVLRTNPGVTVALEIRIVDASGTEQLGYDRIVRPNESSGVDLRIPLSTLSPGAFTLQIAAGDSRNVAKTETGFIVR